ncbi:MAG: hypothetical protein JSV17_02320 [Candidatus Aminicenantes bacterium]|nr:MAG: hypothetical protein JSV17_02320 [Candidatus Aminicenantes bacterium]
MNLQKNLLIIPILIALVWGILGLFFPETVFKLLGLPEENMNVTWKSTQMILGISQICLGIIAIWMRTLKDKAAMSGAMTVVAVVFLLFGLEAVLVNYLVEGLTRNTILFVQGIVLIILGVLFFAVRKPK